MVRILVFDSGYGGDVLADKIARELSDAQVFRTIDWRNAPFSTKSAEEIRKITVNAIRGYIGKVDLIVIGSYEATATALQYLRYKYPGQAFIGAAWPDTRELHGESKLVRKRRMLVLTTGVVRKSREFSKRRRKWIGVAVAIKECNDWERLIDDGEMSGRKLRQDLGRFIASCPEYVMLLSLNFWEVKQELQVLFGPETKILDGRLVMMRAIKTALSRECVVKYEDGR